jgi:hypothetical protein
MSEKINLTEALKKLEEINTWFDDQVEIDVEKGLEKVNSGVLLVKLSRQRLQEIENEFSEIKKELVQTELSSNQPSDDSQQIIY